MKKLIFICFTVFALLLCGCAKTVDGRYGEPINTLADAIKSADAEEYLEAFEDDYIEDLEEYYTIISDTDLLTTVQSTLDQTKNYNKDRCGAFTVISVTEISKQRLDKFPEDASYVGSFEPDGKVEEILSVTISYVIEGMSGSTEAKNATLIIYSVDGEYYLHPMHLMFVFQ